MPYRVRVAESARQEMLRLPGNIRQRIKRLVEALGGDPHGAGAQELRDLPGRYRVRLGEWRVIFRVHEDDEVVTVLAIRRKPGPETYQVVD